MDRYVGDLLQDFYAEDQLTLQEGSLAIDDIQYLNPSKDESRLEEALDSLDEDELIQQVSDDEYQLTEEGKERLEEIITDEGLDELLEDFKDVYNNRDG